VPRWWPSPQQRQHRRVANVFPAQRARRAAVENRVLPKAHSAERVPARQPRRRGVAVNKTNGAAHWATSCVYIQFAELKS